MMFMASSIGRAPSEVGGAVSRRPVQYPAGTAWGIGRGPQNSTPTCQKGGTLNASTLRQILHKQLEGLLVPDLFQYSFSAATYELVQVEISDEIPHAEPS